MQVMQHNFLLVSLRTSPIHENQFILSQDQPQHANGVDTHLNWFSPQGSWSGGKLFQVNAGTLRQPKMYAAASHVSIPNDFNAVLCGGCSTGRCAVPQSVPVVVGWVGVPDTDSLPDQGHIAEGTHAKPCLHAYVWGVLYAQTHCKASSWNWQSVADPGADSKLSQYPHPTLCWPLCALSQSGCSHPEEQKFSKSHAINCNQVAPFPDIKTRACFWKNLKSRTSLMFINYL